MKQVSFVAAVFLLVTVTALAIVLPDAIRNRQLQGWVESVHPGMSFAEVISALPPGYFGTVAHYRLIHEPCAEDVWAPDGTILAAKRAHRCPLRLQPRALSYQSRDNLFLVAGAPASRALQRDTFLGPRQMSDAVTRYMAGKRDWRLSVTYGTVVATYKTIRIVFDSRGKVKYISEVVDWR